MEEEGDPSPLVLLGAEDLLDQLVAPVAAGRRRRHL
jgi:hypothetical protein